MKQNRGGQLKDSSMLTLSEVHLTNLMLQQLDRHCQSSAQQVCELLAKQSQLMQERNVLSVEMQNLRVEIPNMRHEPLST
ncbi:hypothetical protein XENORESO_014202 [Xenotaenia resolanae]|uniref:Uncharacterized protein n=1 Tax=Xenotaenia resolanae TaxID=208358 RepID=A0ABV0X5S0_9TELE